MAYCASLTRHYQDFWSNRGHSFTWPTGPRWELPEDFTVLRFSPSPKRSAWTYATVCMSQEHDEARLELHLFSPVEAAEHVELLTAIAHYHRTGATLGVGHTVNFGRPWLPGSLCTHGLISLPYLDGPELEVLKLNGITVRFLWLIPVTKREVEFKKERGLVALEAEFEKVEFDYLNPHRRSVI